MHQYRNILAIRLISLLLVTFTLEGCNYNHKEEMPDITRTTAIERLHQGKTYLRLDGIDDAISYYNEKNDTTHLPEMYELAAIQMRWKGRQDSAAMFLKHALDFATGQTSPTKSEIYLDLSELYSHPLLKKDYAKAIEYARLADKTCTSDSNKARILHDIGIYYAFLNENDSAVFYLEKALERTAPSSPYYTTFALNYANLPVADFSRSIEYLDKIETESLGKLITKGFLYLNQNRVNSAVSYLNQSLDLFNTNPAKYSINTYNSLRMLSNCISYATTGKVYPGTGTEINDSISERIALNAKIETESAEHNAALEIKLLESRTKTQTVLIAALVIILLGGATFAWIFWSNKRKYIRLNKEFDLLRQNQIMMEAGDETQENDELNTIIKKRAEMCIDRFRQTGASELIQKGETTYNDNNAYLTIKERAFIRQALLESFSDFIIDLKMDAGKLTMDDIVTALLSLMHAQNSAIAACLGVTAGAVRTRKTRLRSRFSPQMADFVFG